MSKQTIYILVALLGAFLVGAGLGKGETQIVEKVVEKPVIQEVVREVEKECPSCQATENNLGLCKEALQLSGEVNIIAGEIFGNINAYIANPSLLSPKIERLKEISAKIRLLQKDVM